MTRHVHWLEDFRWAMNMMRVRRWRRRLGFAERARFDAVLRPPIDPFSVIAYPDAIYHITANDVICAMKAGGPPIYDNKGRLMP